MAPYLSRYLTRLDDEISKAGNGARRDCLIAERVAYLARRGRMQEAKESLHALQAQYRAAPVLEVNCWTLFADAMVQHYDDLKRGARDSFRRCQALAAAYGVSRIDALASAWLALIEYGRNDFALMDQWIRRAFELSRPDDHLIMSRACMVAAVAFQFAGRSELASPWMSRCRAHNSGLGDETTWSSTLHNFAWAKLIDLRQKRAQGTATQDDVDLTRTSIESAEAFDRMARMQSLQTLNEVLVAQIRSISGQHAVAHQMFERLLPEAVQHGLAQWLPILRADAAVSSFLVGNTGEAQRYAESAVGEISATGHPDDVASAHSRLVDYYALVGSQLDVESHAQQAQAHWQRHVSKQEQIVALLTRAPLDAHASG